MVTDKVFIPIFLLEIIQMGKGDLRTRRGKIANSSYGVARPKNNKKKAKK
jgi:ribosomal small subunit protein bTHX